MESIEESFLVTLEKGQLVELAADYAEIGIDQLFGDELTKAVPILATLKKLYGGVASVSNWLFAKKVCRFLFSFHDIPAQDRSTMWAKVAMNQADRKRFGETTLLILDRVSDLEKPHLMGNVCRSFLEGKVTLPELRALYHVIDQIRLDGIEIVRAIWSTSSDPNPRGDLDGPRQHLVVCGLCELVFDAPFQLNGPTRVSTIGTDLGYKFFVHALRGTLAPEQPPIQLKAGEPTILDDCQKLPPFP